MDVCKQVIFDNVIAMRDIRTQKLIEMSGFEKPSAAIVVSNDGVVGAAVEGGKHPLLDVIDSSTEPPLIGAVGYLTDPPCAACIEAANDAWMAKLQWPGGSLKLR